MRTELSTLIVQGWLMQSPPTLAFPFRLRSLVVADLSFKSRYLASFLATVAKSDNASLRSISLPACSKHAHPEVAASLLHFAPTLDHLGLSIGTTDDATPYGELLDACSTLNSLECTSLPVPLLDHLPPSLAILATTEDAQHISVAALGAALERCAKMRRLYFACSRKEWKEVEGGSRLLEEVERRGIDWRFQGEDEEE